MYKIVKRVIMMYYPLIFIVLFFIFAIEVSPYVPEPKNSVWTHWIQESSLREPVHKGWAEFILLLFPLLLILLTITKEIIRQVLNNIVIDNVRSSLFGILCSKKKAEKWAIALGWWIPREYRKPLVGDILEDCHQMREMNFCEWRICTHVLWQWAIGVMTLLPAAIFSAVWQILSQSK